MGKLIILSGPSGVGKGPMVDTLVIYLETKNQKFTKHVLYTTREKKEGEVHRETYLYSYLTDVPDCEHEKIEYNRGEAEIKLLHEQERAKIRKEKFEIFPVHTDQNQGLNYSVLQKELKNYDVVLLEIYQEKIEDVVLFCKSEGIEVKRIFISPLSEEDYKNLGCVGCFSKKKRGIATEATMIVKLRSREREGEDNIKKRAKKAIQEVENARARKEKEVYFVNHFGEDMKTAWADLQKRVKETYYYRKRKELHDKEIDKTFIQFLDYLLPEPPEHNCK
jgi:guanylate kinase